MSSVLKMALDRVDIPWGVLVVFALMVPILALACVIGVGLWIKETFIKMRLRGLR